MSNKIILEKEMDQKESNNILHNYDMDVIPQYLFYRDILGKNSIDDSLKKIFYYLIQ